MASSTLDSAAAQRKARMWNRHSVATLFAALSVLYVLLVCISVGRLLWYDEVFTYYISSVRTIHDLFVAIMNWDQTPPLFYLLSRMSMAVFGHNAVALRLPSVLEFYIACTSLFVYMRRKTGLAYAAIPILILFDNPKFIYYATEARPYALLLMFFSILLLCWDTAINDAQHRRLALWGMALANVGMFASHVFAIISLGPFLAAELLRWYQRRKPDYAVWAVLLLPIMGVFAYRPLFTNYGETVFPAWFAAGPRKIAAFFWHVAAPVLIALVASAVAAKFFERQRRQGDQTRKSTLLDFVFLVVLACGCTAVLGLVLMVRHGAFWDRYCLTSVVGAYLFIGLVFARWLRFNGNAGWLATSVLAAFVLVHRIAIPAYSLSTDKPPRNSAVLTTLRPDLPIVPASGVTFLELNHNDLPEIASRVCYLVDTPAAIKYAHATIFERFDKLKDFFPMRSRVEQYSDFVRTHKEFLVIGATWWPEDWLLKKLAADGATIQSLGDFRIPYLETTLFHVTMPSGAGRQAHSGRTS